MLQSGCGRELSLPSFAVNINIYLHATVGILMGGRGSWLRLWKEITWRATVPINALPDACIYFINFGVHGKHITLSLVNRIYIM